MAIRVVVAGALGKVGRKVIQTIESVEDIELVGAIDVKCVGQPLSEQVVPSPRGLLIEGDIGESLGRARPDVLVDFTAPSAVFANAMTAACMGVRPVLGTTGLRDEDVSAIAAECKRGSIGGAMIHNFAAGAVLLSHMAREAASLFGSCEIIELHDDGKLDAPSGTSLWLKEKVESVTGEQVMIHSVRRPGLVSQHRLIFGGTGETLMLVHDANDVSAFVSGVMRAIRWVVAHTKFATELEDLDD